ncbi:hypothetical protein WPG_0288 [Winogradskyella sp. PG-2]|nr:hypothetical protein WPG_0288 [Winogradskyella sp. PG-2]
MSEELECILIVKDMKVLVNLSCKSKYLKCAVQITKHTGIGNK